MVKKLSLKIKYVPDFKIIGVFCPIKDYRFCWLINSYLGYSFNYFGAFRAVYEKNEDFPYFSVFDYSNDLLLIRMYIINNRNSNRVIFANPPQLDYLLVIDADESRHNLNEVVSAIRNIPNVNAAFFLENQLGKLSEQVFYDFELFITDTDQINKEKALKSNV